MGDSLIVVAGRWEDGKIRIYRVGHYLLEDPVGVIRFYLLLRGIRQLGELYYDEIKALGKLPDAWPLPNTSSPI